MRGWLSSADKIKAQSPKKYSKNVTTMLISVCTGAEVQIRPAEDCGAVLV